jgi:hypothetical protein
VDVPALVKGKDGDSLLCKLVEDMVVAYNMLNEPERDGREGRERGGRGGG